MPSLSRVDKGTLSCKSLTTTAWGKGSYRSWFVIYNQNFLVLISSKKKKRNFSPSDFWRLKRVICYSLFAITGQGPVFWLLCRAADKCACFSLTRFYNYIMCFRTLLRFRLTQEPENKFFLVHNMCQELGMQEVKKTPMSLPSERWEDGDKPADVATVGCRCVRERQEPPGGEACPGRRGPPGFELPRKERAGAGGRTREERMSLDSWPRGLKAVSRLTVRRW